MEHIQTLEDLIPKFESVTSLPKTKSVQQVNDVKGWVLSLMTGCIELRDPRKKGVTPSGDKGTPKPTPIQPLAPASLQDLQKYIPQVLQQMHDLGRKATLTIQEKNLQRASKTNLNLALDDLNNIVRWRQAPSRRQKSGASGTVKEVVQKNTTANKLREAQMVYQILEPLVVEKMLWENMRKHNKDLQSFCKGFEKAEPPLELLWETAEEHIKWYKFVMGNYIHLCKEGEVMSQEEKEDLAANLDVGTGGKSMAPLGTDTPSGIPGGAVGIKRSDEADPVKAGTAKGSKKDDTLLSKSQNSWRDSKDSKEKKKFSDRGTEPKNAGDSEGRARPKKIKPQIRITPTKKPIGKSASHINSSTESEDDGDDGDINDDNFPEPEEKTITMTLRGDPDFEDISLTKNPKMPPPRKRKRPAGEKVIIARTWKPLVFTNKVVRQNPSKTLEVFKGYQDGKKRIVGRSIIVLTDLWKSRVQRRPRKLSLNCFNREAWKDTPMAKIAFT